VCCQGCLLRPLPTLAWLLVLPLPLLLLLSPPLLLLLSPLLLLLHLVVVAGLAASLQVQAVSACHWHPLPPHTAVERAAVV